MCARQRRHSLWNATMDSQLIREGRLVRQRDMGCDTLGKSVLQVLTVVTMLLRREKNTVSKKALIGWWGTSSSSLSSSIIIIIILLSSWESFIVIIIILIINRDHRHHARFWLNNVRSSSNRLNKLVRVQSIQFMPSFVKQWLEKMLLCENVPSETLDISLATTFNVLCTTPRIKGKMAMRAEVWYKCWAIMPFSGHCHLCWHIWATRDAWVVPLGTQFHSQIGSMMCHWLWRESLKTPWLLSFHGTWSSLTMTSGYARQPLQITWMLLDVGLGKKACDSMWLSSIAVSFAVFPLSLKLS